MQNKACEKSNKLVHIRSNDSKITHAARSHKNLQYRPKYVMLGLAVFYNSNSKTSNVKKIYSNLNNIDKKIEFTSDFTPS